MDLVGILICIIGASIVLAIILIYWLRRPYSEPVVKVGKIIDKYEIKGSIEASSLSNFGGFTCYSIPDSFNILILMEKGDKTVFRVPKEKYDVWEIDDSVKVTEYSRIKRVVEN